MPSTPVCQICQENAFKYKCPTCRIRYCSVVCYKTHQESAHPPKEASAVNQVDAGQPDTKIEKGRDEADVDEEKNVTELEELIEENNDKSRPHQNRNDAASDLFAIKTGGDNQHTTMDLASLSEETQSFVTEQLKDLDPLPSKRLVLPLPSQASTISGMDVDDSSLLSQSVLSSMSQDDRLVSLLKSDQLRSMLTVLSKEEKAPDVIMDKYREKEPIFDQFYETIVSHINKGENS